MSRAKAGMTTHDIKEWTRTQLWDQVPISISVIDRGFNIVEANASFTKNYGPWQGRPCYEVYKQKSKRCEHCAAAATFADGEIRVSEERGVVRDGTQTYYLCHLVPLIRSDGEIPFIIEMSTDITSTKLLEQQKLEAERLAAVGQTVAGLAHGIKNVLMGLDGGMYIARSGIERGDTQRLLEGWQMLEDNVARISSFTREFLEFARGRTPVVEWVDPERLAHQVVDLFRETARLRGIEIVCLLSGETKRAQLDAEGIHTCLSNLVSNALDACETSDGPAGEVRVTVYDTNGSLIFEVADNGAGMDYEVKKKVFTNFFSTKTAGKGTGLGLLTTRKIVQEHGGKVSFETSVGYGSKFRLEFPRSRLPQVADGDEAEPSVETPGQQG
jgi:PAS domain S-box-containing protein